MLKEEVESADYTTEKCFLPKMKMLVVKYGQDSNIGEIVIRNWEYQRTVEADVSPQFHLCLSFYIGMYIDVKKSSHVS